MEVMEVKKEAVRPLLPPGFRFRPTDEELIVHYLRRRALATPLPAAVDIPDIRILAHDPSDLLPPGWSEPERYFFTCKEAKYVKGRRANRATGAGYWKATGKEKPVAVAVPAASAARAQAVPVLVGMKRSLVFYRGKPPTGTKTDWVMHEYRLAGAGLAPCRRRHRRPDAKSSGAEEPEPEPDPVRPAEGWVLCRVFRKRGSASSGAPSARGEEERGTGGAEEEEAEQDMEEEEDESANPAGSGFIDFFARADLARRQHRASSPAGVSSSCLTDEQQQQQCRDQETTSRGKGGGA